MAGTSISSSAILAATTIDEPKPAMNSLPMAKVDSVMADDNTTIAADDKDRKANTTTDADAANSADEGVRVLELHEYKAAALSLAEAFRNDHVSRYFLDTPDREHWTGEQKWDLHLKIMEYITYAHLLKGLVTSAGPNYGSVALWMPPGKNIDDMYTIFRSGLWRLNFLLSREGRKRFFSEFFPLLHDAKASTLGARDDDSWYLVYIGTRPGSQGKGYARKLVDFVSAMADKEGRACYLESSNEVNRKIYRKMGFEVAREIWLQRCPRGNVGMDVMVREPRRVGQ